ncbi:MULTISPECIES: CBS domain-containing protein [unclassified Nocardioides]|uniref:CBS domain-containing protein n=1 Tax=unclassified Nocardioides TaxID=2615069 RepID=UPI0013FD9607|nr:MULTISPECIES: CBS domain-containing protein [unclassified Nocardioides]
MAAEPLVGPSVGPSVGPEDDLARAAEVMLEAMVESVPVVDAAGRLVGVITWSDVVARATGRDLRFRGAPERDPRRTGT